MQIESYIDGLKTNPASFAGVPRTLVATMIGVSNQQITNMVQSGDIEEITIEGDDEQSWKLISAASLLAYQERQKKIIPTMTQVEELVLAAAKKGEKLIYGELMAALGLNHRMTNHRRIMGGLLGEVSTKSFKEHGVFASVIVVYKNGGMPRFQFLKWAYRMKFLNGDETIDITDQELVQFWEDQVRQVFDIYGE
jgi:hypothetical protein